MINLNLKYDVLCKYVVLTFLDKIDRCITIFAQNWSLSAQFQIKIWSLIIYVELTFLDKIDRCITIFALNWSLYDQFKP